MADSNAHQWPAELSECVARESAPGRDCFQPSRRFFLVSKELRRLERDGLFLSEVSGRQKYFRLNRKYPLFSDVRNIVAKTIGALAIIRQSLEKIDGIEEAYLYGSFARNQQQGNDRCHAEIDDVESLLS